jgi:cytochrome bd-type quinol oxidase subunit 2
MCFQNSSERRYVIRMVIFMALYCAVLFPVAWASRRGAMPQGGLLYLAAAAPAIPVLGAIWAVLRYVAEEEDEYQRFLRIQAFVWSTGIALAIMTVWGSLQQFAAVPPMPPMYPFFILVVSLGLVQGVITWRRR